MFLRHLKTGHTIEVTDLAELGNPCHATITGQEHFGEEVQAPETYSKHDLIFLSGEPLPRCWSDPNYPRPADVRSRNWPDAEAAGYYGA